MNAWILVANASMAYIYSCDNIRTKEVVLADRLDHPSSREKGSDLVSDRPGHYQVGAAARSAYEKSDPKAIEAENFAVELAHKLKNGFHAHDYEQLVLIASPQFYGLIKKHLSIKVTNFTHIPKDYTKMKSDQLLMQVRQYIFG